MVTAFVLDIELNKDSLQHEVSYAVEQLCVLERAFWKVSSDTSSSASGLIY